MEDEKKLITNQTVNIVGRKIIELTGALEVLSSTEKEVFVKLEGSYMQILGEKLTILKLIPDEKILSVSGTINGVNYQNKPSKKSFFGRVFK